MSDSPSSQDRGQAAEALARRYLEQRGLRLLAQNWRCRRGELDLVMLDVDTVVFVEVRYRGHTAWGGALESIDARKREKLRAAAMHFLQQEARWAQFPCRFDVIAIGAQPEPGPPLSWIQNAFDT